MTKQNDCIADARDAILKAIADLRAAGIPVPAALFLASHALAYADCRLTLLEPAPAPDKPAPRWTRLGEMWSAEQAEHDIVAGYELTAFVIAEDAAKGWPRMIGWEVHGGPKLLDLVTKGDAASFEDAKAQAESAWEAFKKGTTAFHGQGHSGAL